MNYKRVLQNTEQPLKGIFLKKCNWHAKGGERMVSYKIVKTEMAEKEGQAKRETKNMSKN